MAVMDEGDYRTSKSSGGPVPDEEDGESPWLLPIPPDFEKPVNPEKLKMSTPVKGAHSTRKHPQKKSAPMAGTHSTLRPPPQKKSAPMASASTTDETQCAICLCLLSDYSENGPAIMINCGHGFHEFCFNQWIAASQEADLTERCPLCNEGVVMKEGITLDSSQNKMTKMVPDTMDYDQAYSNELMKHKAEDQGSLDEVGDDDDDGDDDMSDHLRHTGPGGTRKSVSFGMAGGPLQALAGSPLQALAGSPLQALQNLDKSDSSRSAPDDYDEYDDESDDESDEQFFFADRDITVHNSLAATGLSPRRRFSNRTLRRGSHFILDQGNKVRMRDTGIPMIHIEEQVDHENPIKGYIKINNPTTPPLHDHVKGLSGGGKRSRKKRIRRMKNKTRKAYPKKRTRKAYPKKRTRKKNKKTRKKTKQK
jgi:hypothetical protein